MSKTVFLDTNVWIDYFEGARSRNRITVELLERCLSDGYKLASASTSIPDLHYILQQDGKREVAQVGGVVTEQDAIVSREYADACIDALTRIAFVIPVGYNDIRMASKLMTLHADFEDNVVVAAAGRLDPVLFVTNDKDLIKHAPLPAMSTVDALSYLKALSDATTIG